MTHGCEPRSDAAGARRARPRLAIAAAAISLGVGGSYASADGMSIAPAPTPPPTITLAHVHNFRAETRWVTFRRGRRVLPTLIVTPTVSPGVSVPVIEFAHGWRSNPRVYASMLRAWGSAGFLVIAPTSPGMARGRGLLAQGPASVVQAGDLPVVLTDVLAMTLPVTPDPTRIALAGHSGGGCAVADMAFNARYRDPRIGAYLIFSGARTNLNSGTRYVRTNPKPVFVADSRDDEFGDFAEAGPLYRQARKPKVLVTIGRGERHLAPWTVPTPFNQRLWNATVDFSQWAFTGRGAPLEAMIDDLRTPGFGINLTVR